MASYDRPELERWRTQAEAALATALTSTAPSWGCFLCEQGAQLVVKGLLHAVGEHEAAWGHDLVLLERRASELFGGDWPPGLDQASARLARHYIPARYPDAHPSGAPDEHYTGADADQARADAQSIHEAVSVVVTLLDQADGENGDG
jgi:HEPN domain-containing protein